MRLLLLAALTTGCGMAVKVKGTTEHKVVVSGAVTADFRVDFNMCQQFSTEELKEKCLDALIDLSATIEELKTEQESLEIPVNN